MAIHLSPIFLSDLTKTLQGEARRLNDWTDVLDRRHATGVGPPGIKMFLAAVNHATDVTGTYRAGTFAQMFDGLGGTARDAPVPTETIRKWRQRKGDAVRYDPRSLSADSRPIHS